MLSSLLLCPLLFTPFAPEFQETEAPAVEVVQESAAPLAAHLPAGTVFHLEIPSLQGVSDHMVGTHLQALLQDSQVQAFLKPIWDQAQEDLDYLLEGEDDAEILRSLVQEFPGSMSFSLLKLEPDSEKGMDQPKIEMVATCELPGKAESLFQLMRDKALENGEAEKVEIAGRPAFRGEEDDMSLHFIHDGERLLFTIGDGVAEAFLAESRSSSLADHADYQQVLTGLNYTEGAVLAYLNFPKLMDLYGEVFQDIFAGAMGEQEGEAMSRIFSENPVYSEIRCLGYTLDRDGQELVDRMFMGTSGNHAPFGKSGPLDGALERHAAFLGEGVDLVATSYVDFADALERAQKEEARQKALMEEMDLDPEFLEAMGSFSIGEILSLIEEKAGLSIEEELVPAMGNHFSLAIAWPKASLMAIPEMTVVLDLRDAETVDALLEEVALQEIEGVRVNRNEWDGHLQYEFALPNSGLPFMPTLSRSGEYLFLTLSPQAMKNQLRGIPEGGSLAEMSEFQKDAARVAEDSLMVVWSNLGSTFEFLYGMVGVAFQVMGQQGDFAEKFDVGMLPDSERIGLYLGTGFFYAQEKAQGYYYEGRSALANPFLGLFTGGMTTVALIGASEGLSEEVKSKKQKTSRENMKAVALALETYKSSVGSGAYPDNLVKLVDRGILQDQDKLVDPADPKPKRVRSGTGDRIKISYTLSKKEALPVGLQEDLPEDCQWVLYTKNPWHRNETRLLVALPHAERVRTVYSWDWEE
ncbi:MAG: hypothetical protein DWQ01_20350 [Planctomycetota bacterium]|nr:MAG: hypothetical protein DWQ01_20350 [Planctomycetota bacterium]